MERSGGSGDAVVDHPLLDLLMLARVPVLARLAIAAVACAIAAGWGLVALRLHQDYASRRAGGESLGAVASLFADGASALTAWPGWAAAILFAFSVWRLRPENPEPPMGRGDTAAMTVAGLRAGLHREYSLSRAGLLIVTTLTLLDLGRLVVAAGAAARGLDWARTGLGWMLVEVAGLLVATITLMVWVKQFRSQLERLGALGGN